MGNSCCRLLVVWFPDDIMPRKLVITREDDSSTGASVCTDSKELAWRARVDLKGRVDKVDETNIGFRWIGKGERSKIGII
ncbi:hypothetical protein SCLCIDRAFT_932722 [Scleroderma citrinum Foug A]|uniref:Uncharacterized protein n=1 Tax=Scleroderma citrinum Foug A TaxID=1036808 RepID=A0A0C3DXR2_9AGAM|nr:hypothetical protein SCLCIDRAFT_932722 [Scleroderma citrinum Foug A]